MINPERKVYAIGETVLDIIFKGDQPIASRPGGSMLNAAVSLGRAGMPVSFISELGGDRIGDLVLDFLVKNRVSTSFIQRYDKGKTPIALADLDRSGNAVYSFYRSFPEHRLTGAFPAVNKDDIVLFGSFFSITREIRDKLIRFIREAREKGAFIIYDPNFRKPHLGELPSVFPWILENIFLSTMVRGSDEDYFYIFGVKKTKEVLTRLNDAKKLRDRDAIPILINTRNKRSVEIFKSNLNLKMPVKTIRPVSTIGAGDAFNAGIVYFIFRNNISKPGITHLNAGQWKRMIGTGIEFATNVCMSYDNYISEDFVKTLPHA